MERNKEQGIRSEKGFTMIELIIVIAIIGILSAVLVPSFTNMSRKSRLRADISTIKQVQTQIDLFVAEKEGEFPGGDDFLSAGDILSDDAVQDLVDGEYIKKADTVGSAGDEIRLQSKAAVLTYDTTVEHLQLSFPTGKEFDLRAKMGEADKEWINDTVIP